MPVPNSGITWSAGDILTAADLTTRFANIENNASAVTASETLTNKTLTAPKFANGGYIADSNANELIKFAVTGSAVNEVQITNATTGNGPTIDPSGETNVDLNISPKGTGHVVVKGAAPVYSNEGDSGTGTVTLDWSSSNIFRIHQNGAFTLAYSNAADKQYIEVWIEADGSNGITFPMKSRWMNATGATDSTTDDPDPTAWTADKYYVLHVRYFSSEDLYYTWVSDLGAIS